jgi:Ca-activated chloride channel family protein
MIDHYIAQYDYNYPLPRQDDLTVTTASGVKDQNAYIQIGLKGRKMDFSALPPLNITFCIDRSGSMAEMMLWVKDSFYIFIDQVRNGDIISLVDMNTNAQTLIPPVTIQSPGDRTRFKREVDRIIANGGTDVYAGMLQSYKEVEKNFDPAYVNRVVLLTDGMHNSGEMRNKNILDLASGYRERGINISTVLLGIQAATGLMTDVAIEGGGSSRFIPDHDEMVKIFQTELDRMLVPAAKELQMRLVLSPGVTLKETWGYKNYQEDNASYYYVSTLHNGDYETIFAELSPDPSVTNLGTLYIDYLDLSNNPKSLGPFQINLAARETGPDQPIADLRVREAEGLLVLARGLIDIANRAGKIASLEMGLYQYEEPSPQRSDLVQQIKLEVTQNLSIIKGLETYLNGINESLGGGKYAKELEILENYTRTFTTVYTRYDEEESQ